MCSLPQGPCTQGIGGPKGPTERACGIFGSVFSAGLVSCDEACPVELEGAAVSDRTL